MKLNKVQEERIAGLLINFSSETVNEILGRFDVTTQENVRARMAALIREGTSSLGSLKEFAEFLYFEPRETGQRMAATRGSRNGAAGQTGLSFQEVLRLDDEALDTLLKAATPDLTISVLCCSPESFIHRVLGRLSSTDADNVRQTINSSPPVNINEMQQIHQRYCAFATRLLDSDLIQR